MHYEDVWLLCCYDKLKFKHTCWIVHLHKGIKLTVLKNNDYHDSVLHCSIVEDR